MIFMINTFVLLFHFCYFIKKVAKYTQRRVYRIIKSFIKFSFIMQLNLLCIAHYTGAAKYEDDDDDIDILVYNIVLS